jgi:ferritin-like metal-binding protein YciE
MQRLESTYDRAVEASLAQTSPDDMAEQLRTYLGDAHALEEQAIQLLEHAPRAAGDPVLANVYTDHLAETRDHAELVEERLHALGGDPSTLKDAAMRLGGLNWSTFFQGHPDTPGKLAAFAYAFEHLEIGGYEQLRRVAERAGDQETARLAEKTIEQEREAASRIESAFDRAAEAALEAVGAR